MVFNKLYESRVCTMDLNYFKDLLFDVINESDLPIQDIETDDANNLFVITVIDGTKYSLHIEKDY